MLIHSCGAALPQNLHDVLVALGLGSDYDELALVIERRGVGLDHIVRQMTIGKMGLKCTDNSGQIRFNTAQILRRNYARRKDRTDRNWTNRIYVTRLFRHDSLIINSAFKSRGSQSLVGLVQVLGVVEYPNNDGFYFR